jgi:hypothetical protein
MSWADMMDEAAPIAKVAESKPKIQKGWTVVAPSKRKPRVVVELEMVQVPLKQRGPAKDIFNELRKVFPNGLTANQIAQKLNQQDVAANFSAQSIGDYLYGDGDDSDLCDYVVPVDPKQRPRVWRIRALTDKK